MKFGVVVFPGSNCDQDCYDVLKDVFNQDVEYVWHKEKSVKKYDCIVLPGGFSFGDYLRTGAIAKFSFVMPYVIEHANKGKLVIGICNGFQILCESGLLPGALHRNTSLHFMCKHLYVRVENNKTPFTRILENKQVLNIPIAHNEGNFYADAKTIEQLKKNDQVVLRYCDKFGNVNDNSNPNGSIENIAGICNLKRNVFGLMPHPERASEDALGSVDGVGIFESILGM